MDELVRRFEDLPPELVFEWNDRLTEAQGWLVINSLRGGAAGGGTRMREGLTREEVISLAKTMEIKFTISGPPIGGAKSGINFDPKDPRRKQVLERWYKAVTPILKNYYGTGGDMNVDEIADVIPITEENGLWHPQEGIVVGHYHPSEKDKINKIGQLRVGVSKIIEDERYTPVTKRNITISDMITGFGVAESVRHYYRLWYDQDCDGRRAIIQGWGNVGASAGFFLSRMGVRIIAIIDRHGGLICEEGFSEDDIRALFLNRKGKELDHPELIPFEEMNSRVWKLNADILIPAAGSRLIAEEPLNELIDQGLGLISSGANVPFCDREIFYGRILEKTDRQISVIPDFIANCGMARVFAYLMGSNIEITDEAIFQDVSKTILKALRELKKDNNSKVLLTRRALHIAIDKLI